VRHSRPRYVSWRVYSIQLRNTVPISIPMRLHSSSSSVLALLCLRCATQLSDVPSRENFYRRNAVSGSLLDVPQGKTPDMHLAGRLTP
jgi:hypothetical protein